MIRLATFPNEWNNHKSNVQALPKQENRAACPIDTNSSIWAAENRRKAITLTETERELLFKQVMLKIK